MSRNSRFVSAAKALLAVQVAGCVGAAGVTAWAAFEVRDMVRERDALAARVAQLEAVIPPAMLPPAPEPGAVPGSVTAADLPANTVGAATTNNSAGSGGGSNGNGSDNGIGNSDNGIGNSDNGDGNILNELDVPDTVDCALRDGRSTQCPLPLQRAEGQWCFDVQRRLAVCPDGPPPPPRECQSVERRPIVCVPPFRRTPVPGVCVDGNNRPMRCPRSVREQDPPRQTDQQQQPATRR